MRCKELSVDRVVALLSSFAALLTAIFALITIFEMQEQRRYSYRPELFFSKTNALIVLSENKTYDEIMWDYVDDTIIDDNSDARRPINVENINLYNIGVGPAKDIRLKWIYPINEIVNFVNKKNKSADFGVELRSKPGHDHAGITIFDGNVKSHSSALTSQELQYALPFSVNNEIYEIKPPYTFFVLLHYFFSTFDDEELSKFFQYTRHPAIRVIVTYKDMGDESHEVIFESRMRLLLIASDPPEHMLHLELSFVRVKGGKSNSR